MRAAAFCPAHKQSLLALVDWHQLKLLLTHKCLHTCIHAHTHARTHAHTNDVFCMGSYHPNAKVPYIYLTQPVVSLCEALQRQSKIEPSIIHWIILNHWSSIRVLLGGQFQSSRSISSLTYFCIFLSHRLPRPPANS